MADIYEIFKFPDISEHVKDVCVNKIGITFPPILTDEEYNSLSAEEKEMRTRQKHIYWDWAATIRFAWQEGYLEGKQKFAKSLYENGLSTENLGKEDDSDAVKDIINKAISDIDALEYDVAISLDDNKAKINSFVTSVNEAVENQRAEDQNTTGINELQITNDGLPVYDLNGKKITRSMLKSGLYIRNGKKVVVK